eukprot:CAMPEP_0178909474 /NCGR_PEP_ID=MMETSP0786-20121207/8535_1 /TAXON_ID=186022 /ORGANISM="Thalassionema frauenfeldii, Strain CCMP 1798" /LENGTH=171 /DNA_ID=CAMNT_0020581565 /DNA_START=287 /DNA_END=802 /DNA_ORIENTATION=-
MDKFMQKFLIYMQGQTKTLTPIPENQNNPFSILAEDTEDEYEDEDKETDEADKEAEEELETEISNWASFQSRVHTEEKEYEEDDLFDEASNISSSFRQNNLTVTKVSQETSRQHTHLSQHARTGSSQQTTSPSSSQTLQTPSKTFHVELSSNNLKDNMTKGTKIQAKDVLH